MVRGFKLVNHLTRDALAIQAPLTVYLPDGRMALCLRREDDCMQAAVATLLQR